jgi:hypothetical protein
MQTAEVAIFSILCLLFLLVGSVLGWIVRTFLYSIQVKTVYAHPEMFDQNGNIIPDEILAVRFENDYEYNEDEEDD